jgi:hypothetical protein
MYTILHGNIFVKFISDAVQGSAKSRTNADLLTQFEQSDHRARSTPDYKQLEINTISSAHFIGILLANTSHDRFVHWPENVLAD